MKKKIKRIVTIMIILVLTLNMNISSIAQDIGYNGDQDHTGNENNENYTNFTNKKYDNWVYWNTQGLRLYVTDRYGNLKQTDNEEDTLDFWYNDNLGKAPRHLKSVKYDTGNYSHKILSMKDLGFNENITKTNYQGEILYETWWFKYGNPYPDTVFKKMMIYLENSPYGVNGTYAADWVLHTYYNNLCERYVQTADDTNEYEYYLHIEHLFALVTPSNHVTWSGSVYEAAYKNVNLRQFQGRFKTEFAKVLRISNFTDEELTDTSNFPHLQPVTNLGTASYAEIRVHAYGINIISFRDAIPIPKETQETEPPTGDIKIKKDKELTMKKIENVDNVEIYTGYTVQNGYYDIGTNGGIPTTEEIRNVIRAQDFMYPKNALSMMKAFLKNLHSINTLPEECTAESVPL